MEKNDPTNGEILAAIENCEWLSENRRVISDPFSGICTGLLLRVVAKKEQEHVWMTIKDWGGG